LSVADSAVRGADDCFERHRLPCGGGRSDEPETLPAGRVAGPHAGRDGALDADPGLPLEESHAPRVGVFSGTARVHHGRFSCAGPVAWLPALCVGLRAPLDGGAWFVNYQYCCLVCKKLTPLVSKRLTFRANFREKMSIALSSWDEHKNRSNPRTSRRHTSHHRTPQENARGRILGQALPAQWPLAGIA